MKIIITMAGEGSRFLKAGYSSPKHEIIALDKSLFEWSMLSFSDFFDETFIFIARKNFYNLRNLENLIEKSGIKKFNIVEINMLTDGQASTAYFADKYILQEEDVLIYNIDTYVEPGYIRKTDFKNVDGLIHVFEAPGDKWSFVQIDEKGKVLEVTEKIRISNLASIGLYYFNRWSQFKNIIYNHKDEIKALYKEAYIAPMYNYLLNNSNIRTVSIPFNKVHILGTPDDLDKFIDYFKSEK